MDLFYIIILYKCMDSHQKQDVTSFFGDVSCDFGHADCASNKPDWSDTSISYTGACHLRRKEKLSILLMVLIRNMCVIEMKHFL